MRKQETKFDSDNESTASASVSNSESKAKVLVVDDDVRILAFIRPSLRLAGYDVITATSGAEALDLVESMKPSIMLLDILMSPMDGFEVLRRLRPLSRLPVIAISAHVSSVDKALSLGANDFLGKPFRPEQLVTKIKTLLSKAG
ncbi:MAG: response regulator transcription factor [Dehalococcoidales bacterium]|nr:response regulator transcription factor [Dehalococcoidales bacterium]